MRSHPSMRGSKDSIEFCEPWLRQATDRGIVSEHLAYQLHAFQSFGLVDRNEFGVLQKLDQLTAGSFASRHGVPIASFGGVQHG
jgi:hypothetical protein